LDQFAARGSRRILTDEKEKNEHSNKPSTNKKLPSGRRQSRLQERLEVFVEFAASQREVLKAVRKKLFN
jgi:hypothetical protein